MFVGCLWLICSVLAFWPFFYQKKLAGLSLSTILTVTDRINMKKNDFNKIDMLKYRKSKILNKFVLF